METHKKIDVSLDEAKEWFNSGNATLKKACESLGLNYDDMFYITKI